MSTKDNIYKKLAHSNKDEKRYILPNKKETLPWGHFKI